MEQPSPSPLEPRVEQVENTTHDQPVPAQAVGSVFKHCAYGAPNFGEDPATDAKEPLALVLLDTPLPKVCSTDLGVEQCEENVRLLQIAAEEERAPAPKELVGRRISFAVAEYMMAITGHHHTRVLLWYSAVTDLGPAREHSLRKQWPNVRTDFIGTSCQGYPR